MNLLQKPGWRENVNTEYTSQVAQDAYNVWKHSVTQDTVKRSGEFQVGKYFYVLYWWKYFSVPWFCSVLPEQGRTDCWRWLLSVSGWCSESKADDGHYFNLWIWGIGHYKEIDMLLSSLLYSGPVQGLLQVWVDWCRRSEGRKEEMDSLFWRCHSRFVEIFITRVILAAKECMINDQWFPHFSSVHHFSEWLQPGVVWRWDNQQNAGEWKTFW